jgi:hypothetical protein
MLGTGKPQFCAPPPPGWVPVREATPPMREGRQAQLSDQVTLYADVRTYWMVQGRQCLHHVMGSPLNIILM